LFGEKYPYLIGNQTNLAINSENLSHYCDADSLWNIIIPSLKDQLNKNYLFLPDNKKLLYLNTNDETFRAFYHFISYYESVPTKLLAANLLINTKSQILDYAISTRRLIENVNDKNLSSISFQLNNINQKVAKAEILTKDELKTRGWNLDSLHLLRLAKVNWQQIQEKLKDEEVLIDYFTFYDRVDSTWVYHAMLIKKDEYQPVFVPLSDTKPVIDLIKIKGNVPAYVQFKEASQELYGYIWETIEPHLKNIKTIHLIQVASVNKVDFESLQNNEGQYLLDLYQFHYYTFSKDFYKQKPDEPNYIEATLYGHIAYYQDTISSTRRQL